MYAVEELQRPIPLKFSMGIIFEKTNKFFKNIFDDVIIFFVFFYSLLIYQFILLVVVYSNQRLFGLTKSLSESKVNQSKQQIFILLSGLCLARFLNILRYQE